jgi:hypothetical protein
VTDWLPEHQRHLLYTLAHVDSVIEQLSGVLDDFWPLEFENLVKDGRDHVLVEKILPVPEAVPRLASDALNQMRSAIEHALYAEVEHLIGRTLDSEEAKGIEMPVKTDEPALAEWARHKRRKTLPVLHLSGELGGRIAELQPYDDDSHPLRLMAEHTNLSKHRMPAVAAVRLGAVVPDYSVPGLWIADEYEDDSPLSVGDVLASVPAGVQVPMSVWPKIGIRRPHTGGWMVLMHELRIAEEWVRTEAIPRLIVGTTSVDPISPHLDISRGYEEFDDAIAAAQSIPAAERQQLRIMGKGVREDLPGVFAQKLPEASREVVDELVAGLSDAAAVEIIRRYMRVRDNRGELHAIAYLRRLVSADGR